MEDITTRAIIIGVSVLIAVATISSVMTYYSTAQEAVRKIGSGTDIAGLYDRGIEDSLLKDSITGVEVKNLINYFYGKSEASIKLENFVVYGDVGTKKISDNISDENFDYVLKNVIPNAKYKVTKEMNNGIINIKISGGS